MSTIKDGMPEKCGWNNKLLPEIVIMVTDSLNPLNMKKQLFYTLSILLGFGYQLSQAQVHELTFKTGQAFRNSSRQPVDSRATSSKSGSKGFGADLGYGHYFKNDNYIRLSGSYSTVSYFSTSTYTSGSLQSEWRYDEKMESFGANAEFGKRLNYKFIDFLAGVGAGFYTSPSHKTNNYTTQRQTPSYPGQLTESTGSMITNVPGATGGLVYLNTSLYFKIYKPLYVGVEVGNGFSFSRQKGSQTSESVETYSNGMNYIVTEQRHIDETRFALQLFRTQLAIRYFFGVRKTVSVLEQTP